MIYNNTLASLNEEELALLFFIGQKFFTWEINYHTLKTLRVNNILKLLDILKPQALEEKQEIFDKLKEKIANQ